MKTSKYFSFISYNSDKFLFDSLSALVYSGYLDYFEFINHKADTDDKQNHKHVFCIPSKVIDTSLIANRLKEFDRLDDNGNELFNSIHYFNHTKTYGDFYWYCLHDKDYLKSKMLERNISYKDSDFVVFDEKTHFYLVNDNPLANYCMCSDLALREFIYQSVLNGVSLHDLLLNVNVPLGKIQNVIHFYNALSIYAPKSDLKRDFVNHAVPTKEQLFKTKVNQRIDEIKAGIATPEEQLFDDEIF